MNTRKSLAHLVVWQITASLILIPFSALAQEGALSRRESELLALRSSWNGQSDFEWGHHVVYARAASGPCAGWPGMFASSTCRQSQGSPGTWPARMSAIASVSCSKSR